MPNDPHHSRFVAVEGHTGTLVIDTGTNTNKSMADWGTFSEFNEAINTRISSLTGGYNLSDFDGLISKHQVEEMYERNLSLERAVDEVRGEIARIFDLQR